MKLRVRLQVRERQPLCVLAIAGSDSGGGAGIQADSRAIRALGGFPVTAITAVTAQSTRGVIAWHPVEPKLIGAQVRAVLDDMRVGAVKIGLLPGAAAVRAVAGALEGRRLPVVLDPVVGSTTGTEFLDEKGRRLMRRLLFPLATVVTPNWPELALFSGGAVEDEAGAERAARRLAAAAGCAVLAKGGHGRGARCADLLVRAGEPVLRFESPRRRTVNTHGTGCTLASAIATGLARGWDLPKAVERARVLLLEGLCAGQDYRWGAGAGPAFPG